eukprot:2152559-Alexandrium_andersonii.AAC.1
MPAGAHTVTIEAGTSRTLDRCLEGFLWLLGAPTTVEHSDPRACGLAVAVRSLNCTGPRSASEFAPKTPEGC